MFRSVLGTDGNADDLLFGNWLTRLVRPQAGGNARWFADEAAGDEGGSGAGEAEDTASDETVEDAPAEPSETTAQPEQHWDKERQFRDELAAANRREAEFRRQNAELQAELEKTRQQLQSLQEQFDDASVEDPSLDEYDNLKKRVLQLDKALRQSTRQLEESRRVIDELRAETEQQRQERLRQEGERMLDAECTALDKQYGAEHRKAALERVNQEFVEYEVESMPPKARAAWIKTALKNAYRDLADAAGNKSATPSKRGKPTAPVDTGTGGAPPSDEIPEGSFAEVAAAIDARNRRRAGLA